jgi:hypothetical protein
VIVLIVKLLHDSPETQANNFVPILADFPSANYFADRDVRDVSNDGTCNNIGSDDRDYQEDG